MDQASLMRCIECRGDLFNDAYRPTGFQWPTVEKGLQVLPLNETHRHIEASVDFADVVDGNDVRFV
ncbi:hypothetical protein A5696_16250 [Mycobacterium sp. E2699]|nr:hypothetical protein A5696_16250 [Mycobacterium sp. E2699]